MHLNGVNGCVEIYNTQGNIMYDKQCFTSKQNLNLNDVPNKIENNLKILLLIMLIILITTGVIYLIINKKKSNRK